MIKGIMGREIRYNGFVSPAPSPPASSTSSRSHPRAALRKRPVRQKPLFCACGAGTPAVAGLCPRCYRAKARSRFYFAGYRDAVLLRDGFRCRGCGAGKTLCVHHRAPGISELHLLITLCACCHARIHRLCALRRFLPDPLVPLWQEQHPAVPLQLQFPFFAVAAAT
jgi:hypothetical protein